MRRTGTERLFPHLKADRYGTYTKMYSTWFNKYLDKHVVDDGRYVGHSLRHTFAEYGEWSGLNQAQLSGILGHQPEGMAAKYGKKRGGRRYFDPAMLAKGMQKFRIEGLDVSHLYGKY
jgi:integrase